MQLMPFYTAAVHRPLTRVAGMGWQNLSEYVLQAFLGTSKQLRQQLRPWIYKLCEYALTKQTVHSQLKIWCHSQICSFFICTFGMWLCVETIIYD